MQRVTGRSLVFILAGLVLVGGLSLWYWASSSQSLRPYSGPVEKITISTSSDAKSGLLFIAQHNGYFLQTGLEVTLKAFPSGKMGCEELKAGRVDIANFADFVLVAQVFGGTTSLRCLGAIAAADDHQLITRKGRGILAAGDLRGRKIGASHGTSAEFFLGRFLAFNDLEWKEIEFVDINPSDTEDALETGRVDAVMIWEQWAEKLKKELGNHFDSWPGQSGQKYYWLLVTGEGFLKARPVVVERLFRALDQAERFLQTHPDESIAIIARQIHQDPAAVKVALNRDRCALSFDQALLIIMEDEARWMIRNNLTKQTRVPNYLGYMKVGALSRVKPPAVTIIVPNNRQ
jgi:ABC-type nitrate/sulfonate/bicarbonate transport system substrate-binding protein